jgi:ribosomal protein S18 acetylase RimI-like enzyme
MPDVNLRAARPDAPDERFLWRMLAKAASWRPDGPAITAAEAAATPGYARYVQGWGRAGDAGVIADADDAPIGACWWRLFTVLDHGYGFVGLDVPEVSIAVAVGARGRGVGTALLKRLIAHALDDDVHALSLSVEFDNPAVRLYERLGFTKIDRAGGAWTMLVDLRAM